MSKPSGPPPQAVMLSMITQHWVARCLHVVAMLNVPDRMKGGPKSAEDLAKAVGAHAPSLKRVMRALASAGVFTEEKDGRFALTPLSDALRSDAPGSVKNFAVFMAQPWHWSVYGDLLETVKTGEPAFPRVHGMPGFDWMAKHPEAMKVFNDAMVGWTQATAAAVCEAYDFSKIKTLVDVGGGVGHLVAAVMKRYSNLKGVVFDLPHVAEGATKTLKDAGIGTRCEIKGGSFFENVPQGDAHILKHILHDWDDERCLTILKQCRASVARDGRILVAEMVLPADGSPFFGKILDIEMLAFTLGGRERTETEYRGLLEGAGYRLTRVVPTPTPVSIVEGVPA